MKKAYLNYLVIPMLLLIVGIILSSCGGGEDGYVNPGLQGEPSNQLISKEVSGYIYHTGSSASSETGEIKEKFIILSSPARGDDSFLSQLWGYFEETSPDSLNSQEMQNLHSRLAVEMENYVPLPEWNPSAQLYTIYQDSKSSSPISVDGSGYFSSTVLVSSKDDNVSFEVILGEDACYPVEAIASSDISSSSEGGTELKSCPEIILTFPGWCEIFAVYGNPSVNLKDAGLTFTLNDPSMGWVTEPFYLKCNGVRNYNVAYGIYISAGNPATPVSTTITAQTATGLTLNIFTEVVKSCGSITGHVGGSGVVPFCGFVYSLGFDAFDCIDEAGNYELKKVFKGHFREVIAVYWVQVNGQLVRHREERTIDFFNGDLTGFDLPEGVQPTPTISPLNSEFYSIPVLTVFNYYDDCLEQLGNPEEATQRCIDWLNGDLPSGPPVPEGVKEARICEGGNICFIIIFVDGFKIMIDPLSEEEKLRYITDIFVEEETQSSVTLDYTIQTSEVYTIKNALFISPYEWELHGLYASASEDFAKENLIGENRYEFREKYEDPPGSGLYEIPQDGVKVISTTPREIKFSKTETIDDMVYYELYMNIGDGYDFKDIVCPLDYKAIPQNDLVYILLHTENVGPLIPADKHYLRICPYVIYPPVFTPTKFGPIYDFAQNHPEFEPLARKIDASKIDSTLSSNAVIYDIVVPISYFTDEVKMSSSNNKPLLMYLCACHSKVWSEYFINHGVKLYLGNKHTLTYAEWEMPLSYHLFKYMIFQSYPPYDVAGYTGSTGIPGNPDWTPPIKPMDAYDALMTLKYYHVNPASYWVGWDMKDSEVAPYYKGTSCPKIYFKGNAEITVTEE